MSDVELIARLRTINKNYEMARGVHVDIRQAADRIEALTAKLAECEARLGKAVEAAEEMSAAFYSNGNVTERHLRACNAGVKLHATLAKIKGESHD